MPHIIAEHSADISSASINNFLPEIQKILAKTKEGNFDLEACKTRAVSFGGYFVGSSSEKSSSFLHITIKILEGRSAEVKKIVAKEVLEAGKIFLQAQKLKSRTDLSVDIVDMERETYQKLTINNA